MTITIIECAICRWRRGLLYLCWLIVLPLVQTVYAGQNDALQTLLASTGIAAVMDSYPQQLHQQLQRKGSLLADTDAATVERRLLSAYRSLDIAALLSRFAATRISPAQLDAILAWYRTSLGRRLLAAERQADSAAGRADRHSFLIEFDKRPVAEGRVRVIRRFEQVAHLSAINLALIRAMFETEFVAANSLRPPSRRLNAEQLKAAVTQQFQGLRELMLAGLAANMMVQSYYTLRSFTDGEITEYIDFLQTDGGQALVRLYQNAPVYLYGQVISRAGLRVPAGFFDSSEATE